MKTHEQRDSGMILGRRLADFSAWRILILAVLVPLAAACTDTVTGPERPSHDTGAHLDDTSRLGEDAISVVQ